MIRNIKLENHLPKFMLEYDELQEILNAENPELQILINKIEVLKDSSFIKYADEGKIKRFEKILNINSSENSSLDVRKQRLLLRWNETLPYSYKFLLRKLDELCGVNNYLIDQDFNNYKITITTHLKLSEEVEELHYLLNKIIPANLIVIINNDIDMMSQTYACGTFFVGASNLYSISLEN